MSRYELIQYWGSEVKGYSNLPPHELISLERLNLTHTLFKELLP